MACRTRLRRDSLPCYGIQWCGMRYRSGGIFEVPEVCASLWYLQQWLGRVSHRHSAERNGSWYGGRTGTESVRACGAEDRVWIREAGSDRTVGEKWITRFLIIQILGWSKVSVMQLCYCLGGSGLESRQGSTFFFSKLARPALGSTQPPNQYVQWLLPGGKAAEAWR